MAAGREQILIVIVEEMVKAPDISICDSCSRLMTTNGELSRAQYAGGGSEEIFLNVAIRLTECCRTF